MQVLGGGRVQAEVNGVAGHDQALIENGVNGELNRDEFVSLSSLQDSLVERWPATGC